MARKFSAFTNNPSRVPLDTLVGLDISAAAAAQNSYWSLNTLFSEITGNVTDGAIRFGGFAAPAVSAAGKGAIYFDSTANAFRVSQNTGAYAGLILGTIANTQVAVGSATGTVTGSSAFTFASGVAAIQGTANPGMTITGTAATESGITVNQSVSGAAADAFHSFQTPSTTVVWRLTTAGFTPTGLIKANQLDMLGATGTVEMLFRLADASTRFVYGVNNVEAASINATASLGLVLGVASSLTGRVRMFNSAGATYTQLSAGNAAASLNYILPATSPSSGYVLSASAPSGSDVTLSWAAAASAASLTATQVGFGDGTNMLSGSADFTYTTAAGQLDISKTVNGSMYLAVTNGSNGAAAQARFAATADVAFTGMIAYSSGFTTSGLRVANSSVIDMDGSAGSIFIGNASGSFRWGLGTTEYARLTTTVFTLFGPTTGSVTGLSVTSAAAGSGTTLTALSSGSNENLALVSKGASTITVNSSGATSTFVVGMGSAQNVTDSFRFASAAGTIWGGFTQRASVGIFISTSAVAAGTGNSAVGLTNSGVIAASDIQIGFSSSVAASDGGVSSITSGFARGPAAGIVRVTNGTTGAGQLLIGTSTDTASAQLTVLSQDSTRSAALFVGASGAATTQRLLNLNTSALVDLGGFTCGGSMVLTNLGTAPSASVTNAALVYVADVAAANAELFARSENGEVSRLTGVTRVLDQDFPATTTTLANITGSSIYGALTFNVEASKTYQFRTVLFIDADAAGGWKITIAGTATAFNVRWHVLGYGVGAGLINNTQWAALGAGSATTSSGVTVYKVEVDGAISVNAAGTLTVQFAQSVANGTSNVKQGSYFTLLQGNV